MHETVARARFHIKQSFEDEVDKSFMSIHSVQFIRFNSFMSIPSFQFFYFNSFMTIRSFHFKSFLSIDSCQFIHFISFQFTSFQPCLFFESSAPARAGHYLVCITPIFGC